MALADNYFEELHKGFLESKQVALHKGLLKYKQVAKQVTLHKEFLKSKQVGLHLCNLILLQRPDFRLLRAGKSFSCCLFQVLAQKGFQFAD